ncbi:hypothetical protein GCM10007304_18230 [Rhodococcoides trifolii]|uniref:Helix-turn-helix domain-containing protein n=1 Tax=Rhodococcoides trifolii TaxID=908250 RepID=A0A917FUS3_9NOCA|nr:helix-turn-helix domain-containing protein [Rhodococcus trifolii]GGG04470.1 hypothetical protein GCM10007304_18230 [Rhodococcus trifolii]
MSNSPWMTPQQAADYADVHINTIRHALWDGRLRGYQRTAPKGIWRIHVDDLDAWIRGDVVSKRKLRSA